MVNFCEFCDNKVEPHNNCTCSTKQLEQDRIRQFESGATRDTDSGKLQYYKFFSPLVLKHIAEYMHQHRKLPDGSLREPDNWQLGIEIDVYMDSLYRHFMDIWTINRGWGPVHDQKDGHVVVATEALAALAFNAMGYLHELLKREYSKSEFQQEPPRTPEAIEPVETWDDGTIPKPLLPPSPAYGWDN